MADDTVALLGQVGIANAGFFGYSMGGGIALQIAIERPELVRKLVLAAVAYKAEGAYPGTSDSVEDINPEMMAATPFGEAYSRMAPNPDDWPRLLKKVGEWGRNFQNWPPEAVQSIKAPAFLVFGDSDVVRPEHAVEVFRLLGGGVAGDLVGLPRSRLAILPGTTHITLVHRADWLLSMVTEFLDGPMPEGQLME